MNDNKRLLREVALGCRCACESIRISEKYSKNKAQRELLYKYATEHKSLGERARALLGGNYPPRASMPVLMTRAHTNLSLTLRSDAPRIADLMLNGCNMGMKSIAGAKNKSPDAGAEAIALANELIRTEENMHHDMLKFVR